MNAADSHDDGVSAANFRVHDAYEISVERVRKPVRFFTNAVNILNSEGYRAQFRSAIEHSVGHSCFAEMKALEHKR